MTEIEQIKLLGKGLIAARKMVDEHIAEGDIINQKKNEIQNKLLTALAKNGLKSIKTETHNFAATTKKDIYIINNLALIEWIEKEKKEEIFMPKKLDMLLVKKYAKKLLKEDGEILAGTEPTETIYLSIKTNK